MSRHLRVLRRCGLVEGRGLDAMLLVFVKIASLHQQLDQFAGAGSVAHVEQELAAQREYRQSIIQEVEAANEELQTAN